MSLSDPIMWEKVGGKWVAEWRGLVLTVEHSEEVSIMTDSLLPSMSLESRR